MNNSENSSKLFNQTISKLQVQYLLARLEVEHLKNGRAIRILNLLRGIYVYKKPILPAIKQIKKILFSTPAEGSLFKKILDLQSTQEKPVARVASIEKKVFYCAHNTLPYDNGGYAVRTHNVVKAIKNKGYDVAVLSRPGYPLDTPNNRHITQASDHVVDGVPYLRTKSPTRKNTPEAVYINACIDHYTDLFSKEKPEIIIAASAYHTALPAIVAANYLGIKTIYEVRGLWEVTALSRDEQYIDHFRYWQQRSYEALTANLASDVWTLTPSMKNELIMRGVQKEKITIFPNCAEIKNKPKNLNSSILRSKLGIQKDDFVIGYIGSWVQYEGLELLVDACLEIISKSKNVKILLVGANEPDAKKNSVQTHETVSRVYCKIKSCSDSNAFILPGRVAHEDVLDYYDLINLCVYPRISQPVTELVSPIKPLEAMSLKKAVVLSSVGGMKEIANNSKAARVFEAGSKESLIEAVEHFLKRPNDLQKYGQNAYEFVKKHRLWANNLPTLK